jgi:hypothetical protein
MIKYFKIRIGYGNGDDKYISIDDSELESAMYCFITNAKGVFNNGVCRGQDIISITEDWHKAMGWNEGYLLGPEDYAELDAKGITREYDGLIGEAKENVNTLIAMKRIDLIGKPGTLKERLNLLDGDSNLQLS